MIITIDGTSGAGKNYVGERLAKKLGYKFYSMGDLMRNIAKRKEMTLGELQKLRDKGPEIDRDVDNYQSELGREEDNFIITGRPSHHFIPHAVKLFLRCEPDEAAKRIFPDLATNERNEGEFRSAEELEQTIKKRDAEDRKRYAKYYKIDINDVTKYDFALNTTRLGKEEAFSIVWKYITAIAKHKLYK